MRHQNFAGAVNYWRAHPEPPNSGVRNIARKSRSVYFPSSLSRCFLNTVNHNGEESSCGTAIRTHSANSGGPLSQQISAQTSTDRMAVRPQPPRQRNLPLARRPPYNSMLSRLRALRQQRLQRLVVLRVHANWFVLACPPTPSPLSP